jgi:acyl carrier protein
MNQAEVIDRLQTIFDDVFLESPRLTPEISAKDVPEWNSLTHISLLMAIEQAFDIRFRLGEVDDAQNVGQLANIIHRRVTEK